VAVRHGRAVRVSDDVPWNEWYHSLAKPSWMPGPRTIRLIRQILYPLIIATFGFVFVQAGRRFRFLG
jgi:benzodiazapine receptor